jgi:hypothetical protein
MGGLCSARGEDEKYVQNSGWKALLEDTIRKSRWTLVLKLVSRK